ncbi:AtpZ/AtpI family protein [Pollutibacter soli]|uniref:AtpZ/AtpI family protein n=1 Tax=Pollutibacter soli TaxID=3034157 RepID=UPI0030137C02
MPSPNNQKDNSGNRNKLLFRYAGLATQFLVSTGIAVFIGYKADRWLSIRFPVFVWLLPLIVIAITIYKVVRDTSKE